MLVSDSLTLFDIGVFLNGQPGGGGGGGMIVLPS